MQNNSKQTEFDQRGSKPKFSCQICSFTCNSFLNFKIHLQNIHSQTAESTENENSQNQTMAMKSLVPPRMAPSQNIQNPTMAMKSLVPPHMAPAQNIQNSTMPMKTPVPQIMAPAQNIQNPSIPMKSLAPQSMAPAHNIQNNNKVHQNPSFQPNPIIKPSVPYKNNNNSSQNAPFLAAPNPNVQSRFSIQNPTLGENIHPQATAQQIQNNNKANQNAPLQATPNPNVKPKFSCKDCNFGCNSLQNYRIHIQTVHGKTDDEIAQKSTSTFKKAVQEKLKGKAAPNFKPDKPKRIVAANFQPETKSGSSGRDIKKLKDYISRADREPLIGLEYVLEYRFKTKGNQIETKYFCDLCECDTDVDPMVEHLAGFGHRKLYLAREYPYVLKAQSNSKEDQSQFIRRMALEIEREEGTKMYMIDSSVWMETMMTLRNADKKIKRKTRWDDDKNDQNRMTKALKFLETFEIYSEIEATTVSRLCEKLTENLRFYHLRAKEDALFPARVARAQDVAMSLMKNAAQQRTHLLNPVQKNPVLKKLKPKMPPPLMQGPPPLPVIPNLNNNLGMPSGFPGTNIQSIDPRHNVPKAPPFQQAQQYPFVPSIEKQAMYRPLMPQMKPQPQKPENTQPENIIKNLSQDDTQFFKKLMTLLEALPQNASSSDSSQMNSKLLMLKSLLNVEKNVEREQANQQLMMQVTAMVKDTISAQNASLNQQLLMLMSSQNTPAMAMNTVPLTNNPMQINDSSTGLVPGMQALGNVQMNTSSLLPINQNFGSQGYGQMGEIAPRPMDQNTYQVPHAEMQDYPSTSQNIDSFGYSSSMEGNFLPKGDPFVSQRDGIVNSLTARQNEQTLISNSDVGYEYNKEWDNSYYSNTSSQASESRFVDRLGKQTPYTRVCLSPNSSQSHYDYNDNTRGEIGIEDMRHGQSLTSYSSSNWHDQDNDIRYTKRARLDLNNRSDRSESYNKQSLESLGIKTEGMPEELLKRIQGKDLFTVSAIISEYSERRSGK